MSREILDAIDAEIATLAREVQTPTGDLGYGRDLSCVTDVSEDLAEVDPFSPIGIAQALVRRFTTARGSLPDDRDYGLDVRTYCNRGVPYSDLRELAGLLRIEGSKDDRIEDLRITVTSTSSGELALEVQIQPADPGVEPFDLTLAVTSAEVIMEALR